MLFSAVNNSTSSYTNSAFIGLFLTNSKKPVNVETLEKKIWQHSSDLETHTVETHIYRLRKKINEKFKDNDFKLNNKKGYKLSN